MLQIMLTMILIVARGRLGGELPDFVDGLPPLEEVTLTAFH
jgi:hypothetical protein